ncbi:hypothetical protein, partial [Agrobacterium sp. NPDC090283]|uniref:hypothetical protein n=1 Tax=Agrobacterium sp. NPDC090283 TaxID=3363920 RepID=UPI00383AA0E1
QTRQERDAVARRVREAAENLTRGCLRNSGLFTEDDEIVATAGIADALTVNREGRPIVVVDWKSDVNPDQETLDHYRGQVHAYLEMTGAELGLIVLMTSATVIAVNPAKVSAPPS